MKPYFETKLGKLYYGDCLDLMKDIPDETIDMILCDLPYGTIACEWDQILPFDKLWKQYERIIKNKGNILLFGSGLFAYKLALSNEKKYRYDLIWKKSKCGSPFTAKYMPLKKHEHILVFGAPASVYNPQMHDGESYKRKWTKNKKNNLQYGIKGVKTNNDGTRHPSTVLEFPQKWRRQDQIHPTQKPIELFDFLIKSYSNSDGIILDNCIGSGTTAMSCESLDRQWIGIEKDEQYCKIAAQRISELRDTILTYGK